MVIEEMDMVYRVYPKCTKIVEQPYYKNYNYRYERTVTEIRELETKIIRLENTIREWEKSSHDSEIRKSISTEQCTLLKRQLIFMIHYYDVLAERSNLILNDLKPIENFDFKNYELVEVEIK